MGLRETLEAATREYEDARNDVELADIRKARWELDALAPELAALVLDMGDLLRKAAYAPVTWSEPGSDGPERADALLARLDQLGKEQE